jgi:CRISPR system Cascade subunit CasE
MYLSRLLLNPRSRQVQREVANPYELHRTIMAAFPKPLPDKERVLHRLDFQPRTGQMILLVQSQLEPDWLMVEPSYLVRTDPFDPFPNPAVKPLTLPLQANQVLSFRLCANPTIKKVRRDDKGERRNSNRVPLLREEQQLTWLHKQAEASGFAVLGVSISQPQKQMGRKKESGAITLYTVQFDGHLQVTDPAAMLEAIKSGIGPAKAFGCGLLSLAPA